MATGYRVFDERYLPTCFGFYNSGATCWWNALLQALLSCTSFNQYLLNHENEFTSNHLASAYIRILRHGVSGGTSAGASTTNVTGLAITALAGYVTEIQRQPEKRIRHPVGQESVQDHFADFLDLLNRPGLDVLFSNRYEYVVICPCGERTVTRRDNERDVFVVLTGDERTSTPEEFAACIRMRCETVDEFRCEKCNKKYTNVPRVQRLTMLREIIPVFYKGVRRQTTWFPPSMQFSCTDGRPLTYRLVSCIEHVGGYNTTTHTSSGHYYAKCLRRTHNTPTTLQYYTLNDCSVSAPHDTIQPTPYAHVLFYHLMPRE